MSKVLLNGHDMELFKNLVNGEWLNGTGETRNINPSDLNDVVGVYALADATTAKTAIAAARAAFKTWKDFPLQPRSDILDKIGNEILARKEELGRLLSREEGKTPARGNWRSHAWRNDFQILCRRGFATKWRAFEFGPPRN